MPGKETGYWMGGKRIEVKRKVTFATDMTAIAVGVVACVVVMITLQSHKPYIHGATKDPSHAPLQCLTHFTTKNDTHVFMFQGTIETRADKRETLRVPLAKLLKIGDIITADTSVTLESILQHMNTSLCHDTVNAQLFSRKTHVKAEAQCVFCGHDTCTFCWAETQNRERRVLCRASVFPRCTSQRGMLVFCLCAHVCSRRLDRVHAPKCRYQ
jgi:uncharacterized CHY-type Zn-finger protein